MSGRGTDAKHNRSKAEPRALRNLHACARWATTSFKQQHICTDIKASPSLITQHARQSKPPFFRTKCLKRSPTYCYTRRRPCSYVCDPGLINTQQSGSIAPLQGVATCSRSVARHLPHFLCTSRKKINKPRHLLKHGQETSSIIASYSFGLCLHFVCVALVRSPYTQSG